MLEKGKRFDLPNKPHMNSEFIRKTALCALGGSITTLIISNSDKKLPSDRYYSSFRQLNSISRSWGGDTALSEDEKTEENVKTKSEPLYYNFLLRQKFIPNVEYPLWDKEWDGGGKGKKVSRSKGVTRHIILVRHGQYDETHREDEKRILTELGREQAKATGRRIAGMIKGVGMGEGGACKVKGVHSSDMARAKETADLIVGEIERATGAKVNR